MTTYFTTDLDGSGQTVAVADAGLDEDHGDFGTRVVGSFDVIGDGSTADKHSGHGTHVSCTVLGWFRGGYGGVAQAADLYFQAMENDNTGNFQSPSLNNLLNTAYNAGARTHTNSWGSSAASQQSKYNSETEDVDDRANHYDRYYNGVQGLTILFAAGNDGPGTSTVSPPATAKNIISVGNHQNRYNGAPDSMMSGSSRGPTEDGRIKPDLVAPGGYVRSCRAQEATDTGSGDVEQHVLPGIRAPPWPPPTQRVQRSWFGNTSRKLHNDHPPKALWSRPCWCLEPKTSAQETFPTKTRDGVASTYETPLRLPGGQGHLGGRPLGDVRYGQQQILLVQRHTRWWPVQGCPDMVG